MEAGSNGFVCGFTHGPSCDVVMSNPEYGQESPGGVTQGCDIPRDDGP